MTDFKRTSAPQTIDGKRWTVQLSDSPPRDWLELFRSSGELANTTQPQRVEFDRASATFKAEEDRVRHWVDSLDKWIASTNARHSLIAERAARDRADRADAATKEQERIQQLNDRFKDL